MCPYPDRLGRLLEESGVWKSWHIHITEHDRRREGGTECGSESTKESGCEHVRCTPKSATYTDAVSA